MCSASCLAHCRRVANAQGNGYRAISPDEAGKQRSHPRARPVRPPPSREGSVNTDPIFIIAIWHDRLATNTPPDIEPTIPMRISDTDAVTGACMRRLMFGVRRSNARGLNVPIQTFKSRRSTRPMNGMEERRLSVRSQGRILKRQCRTRTIRESR